MPRAKSRNRNNQKNRIPKSCAFMVPAVVKRRQAPKNAKKRKPLKPQRFQGFLRHRSDWIRTSGLLVPKGHRSRFPLIYKGFKRFPARFRAVFGLLFPCFRQSSARFIHYAAPVPGFFFLNMVRHVVRVSAIFLQSENSDTGYVPLSG